MKYVIFKNSKGLTQPVIFPDVVTHSAITIEGAKPVSAGFMSIGKLGNVTVIEGMKSESLKLEPAEGDENHLQAVMDNLGAYAFYDGDDE